MATKLDKLLALKAVEQTVVEQRKLTEYECRDELLEAFERDGTDRRTSPFFGPDAGKFSIKRYKAVPGKERTDYALADDAEFAEWLECNHDAAIAFAKANAAMFAERHFDGTGELPDGITRTTYTEPGTPERVTAQLYSFKPEVVIGKLGGNLLEGADRLLLGDGDE